ncbi:MAG: cyclodeaminase/cyclohydrolase family protein [Thermoplasmata archaeon]|nr:cyclodeaminase/cyclohydrolase family protein [Thermoplasmata archaeon]
MMVDKSVRELLDAISSKAPTPGGGSVAALAGAISCSLAAMVCNLTIGKKKYADVEEEMKELLEKMRQRRQEFLNLVEEDAKAFDDVMKAYKEGGDEQEALKKAAKVPYETASNCFAIMDDIFTIAKKGNKNSITDAGVAGYMAHAGFNSALLNVKINLKYIEDENFKKEMEENMEKMMKEMDEKFEKIKEVVEEYL